MIKTYFDITHRRSIEAAYKNSYSKGARHPSRRMSVHDFVYIEKGKWEIIQEDECYAVKEGDVVILTGYARHKGLTPCEDGTETIYIHTDCAEDESINTIKNDSRHLPLSALIHCKGNENVHADFRKIAQCYAVDLPCKEQRLAVLFNKLLLDLYDSENSKASADYDLLRDIELYFCAHPQRFISNSELSKVALLGEKTFTQRFKKITGTTPYQYQIRFKLEQIKEVLIASPEMKLHELALNYGFCDEFHLSKRFRQIYGISPGEYRKSIL